jgi:hypothetical protein
MALTRQHIITSSISDPTLGCQQSIKVLCNISRKPAHTPNYNKYFSAMNMENYLKMNQSEQVRTIIDIMLEVV